LLTKTKGRGEHSSPTKCASTSPYVSTFHPPSLSSGFASSAPPLTFDPFQFKKMHCITSSSGDVMMIQNTSADTILIGNDWQKYKDGGMSRGTYIGSGFSKFTFRVRFIQLFCSCIFTEIVCQGVFKDQHYAIFQSKPLGNEWLTAEANVVSLLQELKMLHIGQYFLSSFISCAKTMGVQLPGALILGMH
jgi:hypothetical protein